MFYRQKISIPVLIFVLPLLLNTGVYAAEAEEGDEEAVEGEQAKSLVRYVPLRPTFVANFGIVEFGRLKYVRADVALKVTSMDAQMSVQYHFPSLRNIMVMLLSRQNEGDVASGAGREQMRKQALTEIQEFLTKEEGAPLVEDVIFTNFVVQH